MNNTSETSKRFWKFCGIRNANPLLLGGGEGKQPLPSTNLLFQWRWEVPRVWDLASEFIGVKKNNSVLVRFGPFYPMRPAPAKLAAEVFADLA